MSENSEGTLSMDDAVAALQASRQAPEAEEAEEPSQEDNSEVETEEVAEVEAEAVDDDPEVEIETDEGAVRLKLSELKNGYLRQSDYTRKTQAAAEARKQAETLKAEADRARQQLSERLQALAAPVEQEPNWDEMLRTQPVQQVMAAQLAWQKRQKMKQQAAQEWRQMAEQQHAEAVAREREALLNAVPEWRDPTKLEAAAKDLATGAPEYGFTPDEIGGLVDHRMIRVLHDALQYRRLQKSKASVEKKVAAVQPSMKPGAKTTPDPKANIEQARAKLQKTHNVDDAVALMRAKRAKA
jgi:hypothetical protein